MKGNSTGFMLLGLTLVSAVSTVALSMMTISGINEQQAMQQQIREVQSFRQTTTKLIEEAAVYSRKNPAMIPVLQQFGIQPTPANPAPGRK
jgi:aromatic ring hydroxylase